MEKPTTFFVITCQMKMQNKASVRHNRKTCALWKTPLLKKRLVDLAQARFKPLPMFWKNNRMELVMWSHWHENSYKFYGFILKKVKNRIYTSQGPMLIHKTVAGKKVDRLLKEINRLEFPTSYLGDDNTWLEWKGVNRRIRLMEEEWVLADLPAEIEKKSR